MMNPEAWTILAVGTALGGLVWQMLRSLRLDMARRFEEVDRKFGDMNGKFGDMNGKFGDMNGKFGEISDNFQDVRHRLERLAADHHGLARELSELRGELRGRLDERARPEPR